jgi:hypothetical protein
MKAQKLIEKMESVRLLTAADILKRRLRPNQFGIIISDFDDDAYESGLADFLQNNTKWRNHQTREAFIAYFNDDEIQLSCEHGGLC